MRALRSRRRRRRRPPSDPDNPAFDIVAFTVVFALFGAWLLYNAHRPTDDEDGFPSPYAISTRLDRSDVPRLPATRAQMIGRLKGIVTSQEEYTGIEIGENEKGLTFRMERNIDGVRLVLAGKIEIDRIPQPARGTIHVHGLSGMQSAQRYYRKGTRAFEKLNAEIKAYSEALCNDARELAEQ